MLIRAFGGAKMVAVRDLKSRELEGEVHGEDIGVLEDLDDICWRRVGAMFFVDNCEIIIG